MSDTLSGGIRTGHPVTGIYDLSAGGTGFWRVLLSNGDVIHILHRVRINRRTAGQLLGFGVRFCVPENRDNAIRISEEVKLFDKTDFSLNKVGEPVK